MLVLQGRVVTAKPFPPDDAAREEQEEGEDEYDEEEVWGGMTPVQAVGFRSEVTESDDGEVRIILFYFLVEVILAVPV